MKEKVVKLWGIIGYIVAVVGIIAALAVFPWTGKNFVFSFLTSIIILVITAMLALLPFTISVALDRLESIDYTLKSVNSKVKSKKKDVNENESEEDSYELFHSNSDSKTHVLSGTWNCSKCGRVNPMYTGTCSCGMDRDMSASDKDIS